MVIRVQNICRCRGIKKGGKLEYLTQIATFLSRIIELSNFLFIFEFSRIREYEMASHFVLPARQGFGCLVNWLFSCLGDWSFGRLVVWSFGCLVAMASQQTGRCPTSPTLRGRDDWRI